MGTFVVEGGHTLSGSIQPQGAKNEALQILCAVLLTPDRIEISNVPDIVDINKLIDILSQLGVKIEKLSPNSYAFQADDIDLNYLTSEAFKTAGRGIRGSIMLVGPLLARFGKGFIPKFHPDYFKHLKNDKIKITKLAQGLPVGGEIEQLDDGTLFSAFKNRVPVTD